jgi:hypothetical protein
MKNKRQPVQRTRERGVALLIAIFVLLLVSVVAIALLVSSGTETALGANYRSSSTVYYAALAGLEEARGRLLPKNPNYFGTAVISPTAQFPLNQTIYVVNALPSETVAPWDPSNQYYDKEYFYEFGRQASAASWQSVASVWNNNAQGIPGPVYKWVRITAATEQSLGLNVNSGSGGLDNTTPIYYNPAQVNSQGNPAPTLIVNASPPSTAVQALQITALAYLPNGSQKYLQYVVAPSLGQNLSFPAGLTLDGPNIGPGNNPFVSQLAMPWSANFVINGQDQSYYSSGTGCVLGSNPSPSPVWAVGYSNNDSSQTKLATAIANGSGYNNGDFLGLTPPPPAPAVPSLGYVGSSPPASGPMLASNLQTISQVNSVVSTLAQQADVTLSGGLTQSDSNNLMPAAMSATNPMTVVVDGDFTENGWSGTGYGILLVAGIFTYDPNSSWNGVILVIGKGAFVVTSGSTNGIINGAVFVANTVDAAGNPLSSLGSPTFDFPTYGSHGITYSSCWVQAVQTAGKYQILSFKEIPVP